MDEPPAGIISYSIPKLPVSRFRQQSSLEQRSWILDHMPTSVLETDSNGHFIFANCSFFRLTGLQPEECRETEWTSIVHPDDKQDFLRFWKGAEVSSSPHPSPRVAGTYAVSVSIPTAAPHVNARTAGVPTVSNASQRIFRFLCTPFDTTPCTPPPPSSARTLTPRKPPTHNELRPISESPPPDPVRRADGSGSDSDTTPSSRGYSETDYTDADTAGETDADYTASETCSESESSWGARRMRRSGKGNTGSVWAPPLPIRFLGEDPHPRPHAPTDARNPALAPSRQRRTHDESDALESRYPAPIGAARELTLSVAVRAGYTAQGALHLVGTFTDVSEPVRHLEYHRDAERVLTRSVLGARGGVWELCVASGQVYMSPLLREMLGHRARGVLRSDEDWARLAHDEDYPAFRAELRRVSQGVQQTLEHKLRLRRKDGSHQWFMVTGQWHRDASLGSAPPSAPAEYVSGLVYSLAHFKSVEARMLKERERLKEENNAKIKFLGKLSQELRQPMNAITTLDNFFRDVELPPLQRTIITTAHQSGLRMARMLQLLSDLHSLQSESLANTPPVPIALAPFLRRVVENYSLAVRRRGIELRAQIYFDPSKNPLHLPATEAPLSPRAFGTILEQVLHPRQHQTERGRPRERQEPITEAERHRCFVSPTIDSMPGRLSSFGSSLSRSPSPSSALLRGGSDSPTALSRLSLESTSSSSSSFEPDAYSFHDTGLHAGSAFHDNAFPHPCSSRSPSPIPAHASLRPVLGHRQRLAQVINELVSNGVKFTTGGSSPPCVYLIARVNGETKRLDWSYNATTGQTTSHARTSSPSRGRASVESPPSSPDRSWDSERISRRSSHASLDTSATSSSFLTADFDPTNIHPPLPSPVGTTYRVSFEIIDTGVGFPEEKLRDLQRELLQPYSSVVSTGAGLGLSFASAFIEEMGGRLEVESMKNKGSRFRFTLDLPISEAEPGPDSESEASDAEHDPAGFAIAPDEDCEADGETRRGAMRARRVVPVPAAASTPAAPTPDAVVSDGAHSTGETPSMGWVSPAPPIAIEAAKPRVLIADDDMVNQMIIQKLVRQLGCLADTVSMGNEVIKRLEETDFPFKSNYDLILMDLQMPWMDGFQTTEIIRKREEQCLPPDRKPITIVALTAYAVEDYRKRCLAIGMNDFLTKPVIEDQLADIFRRWMPHHKAKRRKRRRNRRLSTLSGLIGQDTSSPLAPEANEEE